MKHNILSTLQGMSTFVHVDSCVFTVLHIFPCVGNVSDLKLLVENKTKSLNSHVSYGRKIGGHLLSRILHENFQGAVMNLSF